MIAIADVPDEKWREILSTQVLLTREPNENFKDCFGRPIAIGDVLAHGFRAGNYGGVNVGIVYGFTDNTIQVYRVSESYHWETKPDERWRKRVVDGLKLVKSNIRIAAHTFITGLTEAQLKQQLGIIDATEHSSIQYVSGFDTNVTTVDDADNIIERNSLLD